MRCTPRSILRVNRQEANANQAPNGEHISSGNQGGGQGFHAHSPIARNARVNARITHAAKPRPKTYSVILHQSMSQPTTASTRTIRIAKPIMAPSISANISQTSVHCHHDTSQAHQVEHGHCGGEQGDDCPFGHWLVLLAYVVDLTAPHERRQQGNSGLGFPIYARAQSGDPLPYGRSKS